MTHKELAKINKTFLGIEDHGILTGFLDVKYAGGTYQGIGSYTLDDYDPDLKERVGHAAAGKWLLGVLRVAGVDSWEKLPGRHLWAIRESYKVGAKVIGIQQVKTEGDNIFMFDSMFEGETK